MYHYGYAYLVGYLIAYAGIVAGIWVWRLRRQCERLPVQVKLLRAPGESARRRIDSFDDRLLLHLVGSALLPLLLLISALWAAETMPENVRPWGVGGSLLGSAVVLYFSARWLLRILTRRRDHRLDLFGERSVGEVIESLRTKGFRIFHNVPASEANPVFEMDHVAVGLSGVYVVKTLTRRKRRARAGFDEHKIIFDGQQLVYPWGEDFHGLNQARDHAEWMDRWLVQILGHRVPVVPIIAFPGWWVEEHAVGTVRVANPNQIPAIVLRNSPSLTDEQVDRISRNLEARCRDVES